MIVYSVHYHQINVEQVADIRSCYLFGDNELHNIYNDSFIPSITTKQMLNKLQSTKAAIYLVIMDCIIFTIFSNKV